jgi:alpha-N-arabinofuranosidase
VWVKQKEWSMDPSLFFDDDGRVYYTRHGSGRNGGVYQSEIDIATGKLFAEPRLVWPGTGGIWPEGPHLYKVGGTYYLMISEGGTSYGHMLTVARSKSPWGPYEANPANPILTHKALPEHPLQAMGHADFVQTEAGRVVDGDARDPPDRAPSPHRPRDDARARDVNDGWPVVNGGKPVDVRMTSTSLPPAAPWPRDPCATRSTRRGSPCRGSICAPRRRGSGRSRSGRGCCG